MNLGNPTSCDVSRQTGQVTPFSAEAALPAVAPPLAVTSAVLDSDGLNE